MRECPASGRFWVTTDFRSPYPVGNPTTGTGEHFMRQGPKAVADAGESVSGANRVVDATLAKDRAQAGTGFLARIIHQ